MPHDPERLKEVQAWLHKVASDLRAAEVDLAAAPPLLEDVMFHCQQAIEKAMKVLLVWHDVPFRKTHNLSELAGHCYTVCPQLQPALDEAAPFTEFGWRFRYPATPSFLDEAEVRSKHALARRIVTEILDQLPQGALPEEAI